MFRYRKVVEYHRSCHFCQLCGLLLTESRADHLKVSDDIIALGYQLLSVILSRKKVKTYILCNTDVVSLYESSALHFVSTYS